jgi:hypothetical protein
MRLGAGRPSVSRSGGVGDPRRTKKRGETFGQPFRRGRRPAPNEEARGDLRSAVLERSETRAERRGTMAGSEIRAQPADLPVRDPPQGRDGGVGDPRRT